MTGDNPPPITGPDAGPPPDAQEDRGAPETSTPVDANTSTIPAPDAGRDNVSATPEVGPVGPAEVGPPLCPAATVGEIDLWVAGQGNCSYPTNTVPEFAAAVDRDIYAAGAACGSCLEVASDQGKIIATVVDQYPVPPSPRGHKISLSRAALDRVAGPGASVAHLKWRWVPCPVTGPIIATLKDGSSQFYFEIMLTNVVNRVVTLEFSTAIDNTWREARRTSYNYFRHTPAQGLPSRLRLTDTVGNVVITEPLRWPTNPVTAPLPLNVQFPAACAP